MGSPLCVCVCVVVAAADAVPVPVTACVDVEEDDGVGGWETLCESVPSWLEDCDGDSVAAPLRVAVAETV